MKTSLRSYEKIWMSLSLSLTLCIDLRAALQIGVTVKPTDWKSGAEKEQFKTEKKKKQRSDRIEVKP